MIKFKKGILLKMEEYKKIYRPKSYKYTMAILVYLLFMGAGIGFLLWGILDNELLYTVVAILVLIALVLGIPGLIIFMSYKITVTNEYISALSVPQKKRGLLFKRFSRKKNTIIFNEVKDFYITIDRVWTTIFLYYVFNYKNGEEKKIDMFLLSEKQRDQIIEEIEKHCKHKEDEEYAWTTNK